MARFHVAFIEGSSAGIDGRTDFFGLRSWITIEARNRADAFLEAMRRFGEQGMEVTVLHDGYPDRRPLGYTVEELDTIRAAGGVVRDGYPKAGIQIERIEHA